MARGVFVFCFQGTWVSKRLISSILFPLKANKEAFVYTSELLIQRLFGYCAILNQLLVHVASKMPSSD
jgi:hypothetical protein